MSVRPGGTVTTRFVALGLGAALAAGLTAAPAQALEAAPARVQVAQGVAAAITDEEIARYVQVVYTDLFGREADPEGLATWTSALTNGTPRVAVANAITSSREFRTGLVAGAYDWYLGRDPEPAGLEHWLGAVGGGLTISQLEAGFIGSAEYYAIAGSDDALWVEMLYADVLERGAQPSEVQYWVDRLDAGATRSDVAMGFLLSTEHLSTVVDIYYQWLLGRHLDPSGLQTWVGILQAGGRDENIIGGIIASEEYWLNLG